MSACGTKPMKSMRSGLASNPKRLFLTHQSRGRPLSVQMLGGAILMRPVHLGAKPQHSSQCCS
jgi:hypothetical protein